MRNFTFKNQINVVDPFAYLQIETIEWGSTAIFLMRTRAFSLLSFGESHLDFGPIQDVLDGDDTLPQLDEDIIKQEPTPTEDDSTPTIRERGSKTDPDNPDD